MSALQGFADFLDEKVSGPMAKLAEQRHLKALRDGIVSTLPLVIVGSIFLIIAMFPFPESSFFYDWLNQTDVNGIENKVKLLYPYRVTMYIMTLYAAWGLGYSLSKSYGLRETLGANIAVVSFLLTFIPVSLAEGGFAIPTAYLGGGAMFVMIIVSIITVEMYRFLMNIFPYEDKNPDSIGGEFKSSLKNILPVIIPISIIAFITFGIGFEWHTFINVLVEPLVYAADTLPSVLLLVFLITFLWFFGIHGVSVIGSIARPLWITLREANLEAYELGQQLPHIATEEFFQWFIWIGGAGATLALVILLAFFAKSKYGKQLGRASLPSGIFNINEPIIFGAPIVLNPILMIPFILAPMVLATTAWIAVSSGLVTTAFILVPWTLPAPIGAYLSTGGDPMAIVLSFILIVEAMIIYYPFFKLYDKQLLREENGEIASE